MTVQKKMIFKQVISMRWQKRIKINQQKFFFKRIWLCLNVELPKNTWT